MLYRSIRTAHAVWFLLLFLEPRTGCSQEAFSEELHSLLARHCVSCHSGDDPSGEIDFESLAMRADWLQAPGTALRAMKAIESNAMPPEPEEPLTAADRQRLLGLIRPLFRDGAKLSDAPRTPTRRLNRLQYNYAVRDLFRLNRDVFALPEKLLTRRSNYLSQLDQPMPEVVEAESHSLNPRPGMRGVKSFPKDLRAAHGFDNQANQLTLSPLLLDAFLRLSVSIVESPDFNAETVGIWGEFFAPAGDGAWDADARNRLEAFLRIAFRGRLDDAVLDRYAKYGKAKLASGMSYTETMKKIASAALSSPLFLYRPGDSADGNDGDRQLRLASDLSFLLWSSGPDDALLRLAEREELSNPARLRAAARRMMSDPRIERFLDTFPVQWLQLENVLAATPDPRLQRVFHIDKERPASLQMLIEPLLVFDAVFVEDRPVVELIAPSFSYRSEFLSTWYSGDLEPARVDVEQLLAANRARDLDRQRLEAVIADRRAKLVQLLDPIRQRLLSSRPAGKQLDLKPYAAWEFNGDLKESIRSLDLTAHGNIEFVDGVVVLRKSYLQSKPIGVELKAKTLDVWCQVDGLDQRGGGVMGTQGPGDFFDTIVLGERMPRHWISGSNGFRRTEDFAGSLPEMDDGMIHLTMVYEADGSTRMYRNGQAYGEPFQKGRDVFPANDTTVLFGLRHLPAGGNRYLNVSIDRARLYDRALTGEEVQASHRNAGYVSEQQLAEAMTPAQRASRVSLQTDLKQAQDALKKIPRNESPEEAQRRVREEFDATMRRLVRDQRFRRVATSDRRYGGVITNAATLSMTSGPTRTHPIARGAWIIEVIFNDPPPPPPNDVPPLNEDAGPENLTIREKFAQHRENPDCAGCHSKLDPLGFALENFDITGRWRDTYGNGRRVDSSGSLLRHHAFEGVIEFKRLIAEQQEDRFAKAFTSHLLRFALSRELAPVDAVAVEDILARAKSSRYSLRSLLMELITSDRFRHADQDRRQ